MKKKFILFTIIFILASSSLSSNKNRIHLKAYVPVIISITTSPEGKLEVTLNNNDAYYQLSNSNGITTDYKEASFFNLIMI